ncbi:MAG: hypothetical protein V3V29_00745 [Acidimicrobiia bacterium]
MPLAGPSRVGRVGFPTIRCLLAALLVVIASAIPAGATLLPPPIRLALLFERTPWADVIASAEPVPPGHIVVRWER